MLRISHPHGCNAARATSAAVAVPAVGVPPIATTWAGAPCTTSATCAVADHSTCASSTPSTAATAAGAASRPTCPTWPRRAATTPTGSSLCPYAWWRRTGYPIGRPPGICGVTTASLFPTPRSRTGSRRRGKKRRRAGRGQPPGLGLGRLLRLPGRRVDELYGRPLLRALGRGRPQSASAAIRGARP